MAETSIMEGLMRVPEARYAYYRRCQVFRRNGEQCKAPAEKGSYICHAHAGQLALAVRRERERRAVLAEAVTEMRRRGNAEYEAKDLFMDFTGIQVTLAKMMQALIDGRIDCKTAGRLVVQLQMASKMLWTYHRGHREAQRTTRALTTKDTRSTPLSQAQGRSGQASEDEELPQICADERRLSRKGSTAKDTRSTPLSRAQGGSGQASEHEEKKQVIWAASHSGASHSDANHSGADHSGADHSDANQGEETRIALVAEVRASKPCESWPHAPPQWMEPTRHQTRGCRPPEWARAA